MLYCLQCDLGDWFCDCWLLCFDFNSVGMTILLLVVFIVIYCDLFGCVIATSLLVLYC